ncbi:MAG: hypothetical protein HY698_07165 [Deltaproteobacteria bacterium]|nr:hypothetical protein [Deltaproteobacteria bacterium]
MKKIGFEFQETLSGTFERVGKNEPPRPFRLEAHMVASDAVRTLHDKRVAITGTLDAEGFAEDVPVEGNLELAPVSRRVIRYEFCFVGNDGIPYRFVGQKDIRLSDLLGSLTKLEGIIHDMDGREVARAHLAFHLGSDLIPFLLSIRPAHAN